MSEPFVSNKTVFVFAGATFLCSLGAFAVMMVSYIEFQKISPIVELEQQLGLSAVSSVALAFETAVGSAGLLMVLSILYAAASLRLQYRKEFFFFFSFAVTTCAVLAVATGVVMFEFSTRHKELYCEDAACNPVDTPFESWQIELIHTELSLFNECCNANIDAFDAAQTAELPGLGYADIALKATRVQVGDTQECQTEASGAFNVSLTCDPVQAPGIISTLSGLETIVDRLCTCIPTLTTSASATRSKIQQLGTCNKLSNIDIPIDPDVEDIPSTFITLAFVLNQYPWYGNNKDLVKSVPLVATPGIPLPSTANRGFGCGLGFGKGFIWYSDLFYQHTLRIASYAAMGYGCSMTVFALSAVAYVYLSLSDGSDLKEIYDDYGYATPAPPTTPKPVRKVSRRRLKPKKHVPSTESIVQAHVPKKKTRRRKRRYPRLSKGEVVEEDSDEEQEEETVAPPTKEELEAKIIRFYKKFEPSKLVDGGVDPTVLSFVLDSGVDLFNQRLREKYGVDLDHDIGDIV